jgi:hypothetical protein
MLSLAHRRVIAALVCLWITILWIDRQTSQPPQYQQSHASTNNNPKQEALSTPTEDLIFGWQAIDVFTGLLVFATLILAYIAGRQIRHSRITERAYVSGGGLYNTAVQRFELHINNYGKTPGEILRIEIGFCEQTAIPPTPQYDPQSEIVIRDFLPPNLQSRRFSFIAVPGHLRAPVIYGRFHYRDIFRRGFRSAGFIQSIDRNTGASFPIPAPNAYTDETDDR